MTLHNECIGFEQRVMLMMCKSFPEVCNIHQNHDWFTMGMGRGWVRSVTYDFSQPMTLIYMYNETQLLGTTACDLPY